MIQDGGHLACYSETSVYRENIWFALFFYISFCIILTVSNIFDVKSLLLRIDVKPHVNYIKQSLGHTNAVSFWDYDRCVGTDSS